MHADRVRGEMSKHAGQPVRKMSYNLNPETRRNSNYGLDVVSSVILFLLVSQGLDCERYLTAVEDKYASAEACIDDCRAIGMDE